MNRARRGSRAWREAEENLNFWQGRVVMLELLQKKQSEEKKAAKKAAPKGTIAVRGHKRRGYCVPETSVRPHERRRTKKGE